MIFAVSPDAPSKLQKTLGYRVQIAGVGARKVYKQPTFNPPNGMEILVKDEYDMVLVETACAYLVKNAIA